jgi:Zn ribbon nucleic-acid-binding protein
MGGVMIATLLLKCSDCKVQSFAIWDLDEKIEYVECEKCGCNNLSLLGYIASEPIEITGIRIKEE